MSNEAALFVGELLRLFVLETRQRAGIIAECENAVDGKEMSTNIVSIRSDHITQVAAEMLMDFS